MRALVQRVRRAQVIVDGATVGEIGVGLLVFLGVFETDGPADADALARRVAEARVFEDPDGKMNLALAQVQGRVLVVSQFTLCADTRQRRPSFMAAMKPGPAEVLYTRFCSTLEGLGIRVATGVFGADMTVSLENAGPVTLLYEAP